MEQWITFASRNQIGLVRPDGTGLHTLEFGMPSQLNWQLGPCFADGERCVLTSYEAGKPWEHMVHTHLWLYHFRRGTLDELATQQRLAPMTLCAALLPGEARMVMAPIIDHEQLIYTANLDGSEPEALTSAGEGFAYGVTLSPDASRLAYHITGPGDLPYRVCVMRCDGTHKVTVAHQEGHLYFGPAWSPDGAWLAFEDCRYQEDPGHDWADLCLGDPADADHQPVRGLTSDRRQWFGTSFGGPQTRGSGSEMACWSPDGQWITYTRASPGACTAWPYQSQRPDTDHFNRDYLPEQACGGTQVCLLNPFDGRVKELTPYEPLVWNFRARWSPDGEHMSFSRARVGQPSEVWVMDAEGAHARLLTRGFDNAGADHARWLVLK